MAPIALSDYLGVVLVALAIAYVNEYRSSVAASIIALFINPMALKQQVFLYKVKGIEKAESQSKEAAVLLLAPCSQESARYCINKCRSHLHIILVLKPGLNSHKGNRSPGLYSSTIIL